MTQNQPRLFDADSNHLEDVTVERTRENCGPEDGPRVVLKADVSGLLKAHIVSALIEAVPALRYQDARAFVDANGLGEDSIAITDPIVTAPLDLDTTPVQRVEQIVEDYDFAMTGGTEPITSAGDLIADLVHYILVNDDSETITSVLDRAAGHVFAERAETEDKHGQDI